VREHSTSKPVGTVDVHVELLVDPFGGNVLDGAGLAVSGIVDETVEPTRLLGDPLDDIPHVLVVGDVECGRLTARIDQSIEIALVAGGRVHSPFVLEKGPRARPADTRRTPGDENRLRSCRGHVVELAPTVVK